MLELENGESKKKIQVRLRTVLCLVSYHFCFSGPPPSLFPHPLFICLPNSIFPSYPFFLHSWTLLHLVYFPYDSVSTLLFVNLLHLSTLSLLLLSHLLPHYPSSDSLSIRFLSRYSLPPPLLSNSCVMSASVS